MRQGKRSPMPHAWLVKLLRGRYPPRFPIGLNLVTIPTYRYLLCHIMLWLSELLAVISVTSLIWWWWWYHSLTARQHQKGHTVPKQVIMIATSIQVATVLRTALCESIRYQVKSEQNVRQDPIPRVRHGEAALMHPFFNMLFTWNCWVICV